MSRDFGTQGAEVSRMDDLERRVKELEGWVETLRKLMRPPPPMMPGSAGCMCPPGAERGCSGVFCPRRGGGWVIT